MKFTSILPLIIFTSLVSCAHHQYPQYSQLTVEDQETLNREALKIASSRLETMVAAAQKDESVKNYLASDLFLKANMSLLNGDFTTANELFKHLNRLVPDESFIQKKYAISLIRGGELESAQSVLETLWKKEKEERVGLILAGVYTGLDQAHASINIYKEILAINKKSEDACVFLSKGYVLKKMTSKAISQLQECSQNNPKSGMFEFYLGKMYQDLKKVDQAIASFNSALKRQPGLSAAVSALGSIYEEKENFPKASQIYKEHLKKYPRDREILTHVVNTLFLMEKYEEVIGYAEMLSDIDSENLNLKVKLGVLYTDTKQYHKAIGVFRDILKAAPESDKILYYLGAIYQETKNLETSIDFFNRITPQSGLYTDSSIQVANMLSHLAQSSEEESKWHQAFINHIDKRIEELKDTRVEFSVIKAGFFENKGDYSKATEILSQVSEEKSFSDQHRYYLANLYTKIHKYEESTKLVMSILQKDPKNAHAWNFLGYSLLERDENLDKAFEYIQKAIALAPNDGYIRDSLGWYYYKTGQFDLALKELNVAFKHAPGDVEILKHLAMVHKELKNFNQARTFIDQALGQAKFEDERQKILAVKEGIESDRLPASGSDN